MEASAKRVQRFSGESRATRFLKQMRGLPVPLPAN
jgi:hypothetical protein